MSEEKVEQLAHIAYALCAIQAAVPAKLFAFCLLGKFVLVVKINSCDTIAFSITATSSLHGLVIQMQSEIDDSN